MEKKYTGNNTDEGQPLQFLLSFKSPGVTGFSLWPVIFSEQHGVQGDTDSQC